MNDKIGAKEWLEGLSSVEDAFDAWQSRQFFSFYEKEIASMHFCMIAGFGGSKLPKAFIDARSSMRVEEIATVRAQVDAWYSKFMEDNKEKYADLMVD